LVERFDGREPDEPPRGRRFVPPCSSKYAADGLLVFHYADAVTAARSRRCPISANLKENSRPLRVHAGGALETQLSKVVAEAGRISVFRKCFSFFSDSITSIFSFECAI
jgi:hypothetical protein